MKRKQIRVQSPDDIVPGTIARDKAGFFLILRQIRDAEWFGAGLCVENPDGTKFLGTRLGDKTGEIRLLSLHNWNEPKLLKLYAPRLVPITKAEKK